MLWGTSDGKPDAAILFRAESRGAGAADRRDLAGQQSIVEDVPEPVLPPGIAAGTDRRGQRCRAPESRLDPAGAPARTAAGGPLHDMPPGRGRSHHGKGAAAVHL